MANIEALLGALWRLARGTLHTPPLFQTACHEVALAPKPERRLLSRHALACNTHNDGLSSVCLLLCLGGPKAIVRGIRSVIVSALKGSALWSAAHVGKEVFEAVAPSVAHNDAPPSISVKVRAARIMASPPHINPDSIFDRLTGTVRRDGGELCGPHGDISLAAAVRRFPRAEVSDAHVAFSSAFAAATSLAPVTSEDGPLPISREQSCGLPSLGAAARDNFPCPKVGSRGDHDICSAVTFAFNQSVRSSPPNDCQAAISGVEWLPLNHGEVPPSNQEVM